MTGEIIEKTADAREEAKKELVTWPAIVISDFGDKNAAWSERIGLSK